MKKIFLILVALNLVGACFAQNSNANIGGVNFGTGAATPGACTAPSYFTNTTTKVYSVCGAGGTYIGIGTSAGITFPLQASAGALNTPPYSFSAAPTEGLFDDTANGAVDLVRSGVAALGAESNAAVVPVASMFAWGSGAVGATSKDTSLSRIAAGVVGIGKGTAAQTTGSLKLSSIMSLGTKFTSNAGCTEGTLVGGASAGKFTIGTGGSCTVIVTMGDTDTSPNGWACQISDMTTSIDAYNVHESASNATTATFVVGTAISSDVIQFSCIGY